MQKLNDLKLTIGENNVTICRGMGMIERMFSDVKDSVRKQIHALYDEDISDGKATYKESCAKWHWILLVYCNNKEDFRKYVDRIQTAFMNKEDLDKDKLWISEMRKIIPKLFWEKEIKNKRFDFKIR